MQNALIWAETGNFSENGPKLAPNLATFAWNFVLNSVQIGTLKW